MKPAIRAVFFDYDGVLTLDSTGTLTTGRFLSEHTGLALDRVLLALRRHNPSLNDGHATYAAVWPALCNELGHDLPLEMLTSAFESTPLNKSMWQLARKLKRRCFVGMITDNKQDRMNCLKRFQRLADVFDPIVVSAEVGSTKSDRFIFEHALAALRLAPDETVFIDNTRANLVVPAALGMRTVWFDDEKNDVAALERTLDVELGVVAAR